jgi:hypothetical protein
MAPLRRVGCAIASSRAVGGYRQEGFADGVVGGLASRAGVASPAPRLELALGVEVGRARYDGSQRKRGDPFRFRVGALLTMTVLDALLALLLRLSVRDVVVLDRGRLLHEQGRERFEPAAGRAAPSRLVSTGLDPWCPASTRRDGADETFAALDAIDYPDYEIIAINDGSRDRTALVLEGIAARMPRLRVVNLATNQGKVHRAQRRRARCPQR